MCYFDNKYMSKFGNYFYTISTKIFIIFLGVKIEKLCVPKTFNTNN